MNTEELIFTPDGASTDQLVAIGGFCDSLTREGVDVHRIELTESDDVKLEYTILEGTGYEQADQLRYIGGAFIPPQGDGDLADLKVTAHAPTGETATWCVKESWGEKWRSGEWSDETVAKAIQRTFEEVN
ncbi:hypothetical protein [Natrialba sp. INN-245]|uniref:hypothetical protein n=1 Tax=Natrialba sp. INN-245 TaxID=2690967 RepID=UPI001310A609|nr:hypothetical protein [Natrialba sp. INN-245]MWV40128.1 hypothetical protein [Natrialba sp. INN-245]